MSNEDDRPKRTRVLTTFSPSEYDRIDELCKKGEYKSMSDTVRQLTVKQMDSEDTCKRKNSR